MDRFATTDVDIHPLLRKRHSPYAFDPDRNVEEADVHALFEAARWTMSSYNAQPWRYIVAARNRNPETWEKLYSVLLEGNQPWAMNAPVLALGVVQHVFEYNGKENKAAAHDLGAASALLTMEATARGLVVHQMIGIDLASARAVFGIEKPLEPLTALAIGYAGASYHVSEAYSARDEKPRERMSLDEIVIRGSF
jgi:nitroreductase